MIRERVSYDPENDRPLLERERFRDSANTVRLHIYEQRRSVEGLDAIKRLAVGPVILAVNAMRRTGEHWRRRIRAQSDFYHLIRCDSLRLGNFRDGTQV